MTLGENTNERIRVAFADDSTITQLLITTLINHDERFELLLGADHGQMLLDKLTEATILPDICILDLYMQPINGVETARQIKAHYPAVVTFGYSTSTEEKDIRDMREAGAVNVFDKNRLSVGELLDIIHQHVNTAQ
ncbi:response regulator [Sphingobacterium oryzagri]|uniref:Response regulator n=1 Tax=Sphingobacterium oryzagri TaxID=3025669 RepID=A0ABY7WQT1_9SPHI|nr:response regulator [Sphingobacterium sp. KACC 22765]WDF69674.1 response regulator [Sphingobacterium sp. KACC 22765]